MMWKRTLGACIGFAALVLLHGAPAYALQAGLNTDVHQDAAPSPDQQIGACCYGMAAPLCVMTDQMTCEQQFMGQWKGPGTDCSDLNSNGVADICEGGEQPEACCGPDGRCYQELPGSCRLQGGVPQGPGSICLGDANGNGVDEACESLPLKWIQRPDTSQTGVDVRDSKPLILADDFQCTERTLITDITVWGSWRNEMEPNYQQAGNVRFTLSLHKDISDDPANPDDWSRPGDVLWIKTFEPGSFAYAVEAQGIREWWMDPSTNEAFFPGDQVCWKYDFQIPPEEAFCRQGSPDKPIVYWLDVQAEPTGATMSEFGWKSSYQHWNDDAVWGTGQEPYTGPWNELRYPPNHIWQGESMDLAFAISGDQPCEETGACCFDDPTGIGVLCAIMDQATCLQQPNGQWKGPGTDCTDADGNGVADICEEQQGEMDFGDAPEGTLAYPNGVMGSFPTCMNVGPALWIQHTNFGAWFGPSVDFEPDGNGGLCPMFAPYDNDECMNDGDAGLVFPVSYTMVGPAVVPCPQSPGGPLGSTCATAKWGGNIDIILQNFMPNQSWGYVNVLIDWDQNGQWAGGSMCPNGGAPEHVLVNLPVPPGFAGPLSALAPPAFLIGPQAGYVWVRFSITERPVPVGWDGSGAFEDGETEDYLLHIVETDWGDAPDPRYPTLSASGGASHVIVPGMFLGNIIDAEVDGQPTPLADGDDLTGLPDEDGVTFLNNLARGRVATIQVVASVPGMLDAWVDFQANGTWADPIDQIAASMPLNPGPNVLSFVVPPTAALGTTFARFRYSSAGGLPFTGPAPDGEVEDYMVAIKPARVVGRWIFYNQSYWDGNNAAPNVQDDGAIAPDKVALLPGNPATTANYISYNKSINGIMVDIQDLAGTPTPADFTFLNAGKSGTGVGPVPLPSSVTVRPGAGLGGSDRVTIIWPTNAIPNTIWLKTIVLPTVQTGLAATDVFYFGIAKGESLTPNGGMAIVDATDEINARNDPHTPFNPATIWNKHDYNRDRLVDATDQIIARNNRTTPFTALVLMGSAPP